MNLDKAKGVIFGLAIGDALGAPTEFIKFPEIKRRYGPEGISDIPDPVTLRRCRALLRKDLAKLTRLKLVEKHGAARATYYVLKGQLPTE